MPQPTKAYPSMEDAFLLFAVENLEQVKTNFQHDHERSSMLLQIHNELRRLWNQASEQVKNDYLTILLMGQQKNTAIHDSPIVDHNNEHVFDDDNIHVGQEKKRKIENVKPLVTTLLCDDVLKQILFFLDAPDFVNSQPWLVCKQWNQIFFKKGPGFAKLYCHSYFKLDEDQKNSLHQMLLENMFPYRAVFSTLLDCFKCNFTQHHDRLLKRYEHERTQDVLAEMEILLKQEQSQFKLSRNMISKKLPKFAVIRMPSKPKKVVTILNENLFRHVMVINHQVEHLQGKESTLCTMTTYCFAFLSNGYPLIVTIECKHEKLNIEVGDDAIGSLRSKTTIYLDQVKAFKATSEIRAFPYWIYGGGDVFTNVKYDNLKELEKFLKLETQEQIDEKLHACIVFYWLKEFVDFSVPDLINDEKWPSVKFRDMPKKKKD